MDHSTDGGSSEREFGRPSVRRGGGRGGRDGGNDPRASSNWRGPLGRFAGLLLLGYLGLCALAFAFQSSLVYFPGPPPVRTPADHGLAFEEVWIEVEDGERIHAWWLPHEGSGGGSGEGRGAVVFCHGNAGSIQHRIQAATQFTIRGLGVLLFDYRGFGSSDGRPSEAGTYADALAAYEYLLSDRGIAPERILVHGRSLGGAVAVELAVIRPVGGLFLEATFASLAEVAGEAYPWLPVRLLLRLRYDSLAKIGGLQCPLLMAHSPDDELVPIASARRLFDAAPEPKRFVATGGGHNDAGYRSDAAAVAQLEVFLERVFGQR